MTTFSEDFPSLKDKIEWPNNVNLYNIQQNCVDKARIREIIDKECERLNEAAKNKLKGTRVTHDMEVFRKAYIEEFVKGFNFTIKKELNLE